MKTESSNAWRKLGDVSILNDQEHKQWLLAQARLLLDFFKPNIRNNMGGFNNLDTWGLPLPSDIATQGNVRQLHDTTRQIHCFSIAKLMNYPGSEDIVDHGMTFLWSRHRDTLKGGYYWGVDDSLVVDGTKQAYGHAFVLLAASSAKTIGHPLADEIMADVTDTIVSNFWDSGLGASSEEFTRNWEPISTYRGQNSNMHMTEAFMAAFEATSEKTYLDMAISIAERIINQHARNLGWRVGEHFDENWKLDRIYTGDPMFRPAGITPGHALEWSRLLIQLWSLNDSQDDWMLEASKNLFKRATVSGWCSNFGGFHYTLNWDDTPDKSDKFWWPCCEGIGAAAVLAKLEKTQEYEAWYRKTWAFVDANFIDHDQGGWFPELNSELSAVNRMFAGKPDLYHALQACLIPLLGETGSITRGLQEEGSPRFDM